MAETQEKKVCSCCTKHTMRSEEERKKLINRLKRVEGQIRGIIGMLDPDLPNKMSPAHCQVPPVQVLRKAPLSAVSHLCLTLLQTILPLKLIYINHL